LKDKVKTVGNTPIGGNDVVKVEPESQVNPIDDKDIMVETDGWWLMDQIPLH
jgi:hypothetical protein